MLPRWLNSKNEWNHDDRVEQIRQGWITSQHYKTQCFEIPKFKGFTIGFPTEQLWEKYILTGPVMTHSFKSYAEWYISYHKPTNQWKDLIPRATNVPCMVPFYDIFLQVKSGATEVETPTDDDIANFDCYFYDACCDLQLGNVSVNRLKSVNWLFDRYKNQTKGMLRSRCKSLLFDAFVFYVSCRNILKPPEWIKKSDGSQYFFTIDKSNIQPQIDQYAVKFMLKVMAQKLHCVDFDEIFEKTNKQYEKLKSEFWTQQDSRIDTELMNIMQLQYFYTIHSNDQQIEADVAEPWFAELEENYK